MTRVRWWLYRYCRCYRRHVDRQWLRLRLADAQTVLTEAELVVIDHAADLGLQGYISLEQARAIVHPDLYEVTGADVGHR